MEPRPSSVEQPSRRSFLRGAATLAAPAVLAAGATSVAQARGPFSDAPFPMPVQFKPPVGGASLRPGELSKPAHAAAAKTNMTTLLRHLRRNQNTRFAPNTRSPGFGGIAQHFKEIKKHEEDHVTFLVNALGSNARPKPNFMRLEQPNILFFVVISDMFENTGSGAYTGAAPSIFSHDILGAAASIALVEGRHAGWLNSLVGLPLTFNVTGTAPSFETALSQSLVVDLISPFVSDLNGGPPLSFDTTPSAANDIAILNFALALEYLERDFYDINVPKFFGG